MDKSNIFAQSISSAPIVASLKTFESSIDVSLLNILLAFVPTPMMARTDRDGQV